jgi:hypothetical protein
MSHDHKPSSRRNESRELLLASLLLTLLFVSLL